MEVVDIKSLPAKVTPIQKRVNAKLITQSLGEGEEKKMYIVRLEMEEDPEGTDLYVQAESKSVINFNAFPKETSETTTDNLVEKKTEATDEQS